MRPSSALLRQYLPIVLAFAMSTMSLHANAQWKWRDKDGRVTVSDRPPPGDVADKDILTRPAADARRSTAAAAAATAAAASGPASAPGLAPSAPTKGPLDRELDARKRAAEQEQAAKTKAEETRMAGVRGDNCRRARSHQAALDSGQRVARVNEKGEREVLDDRARTDELRQVREVIASDCR